MMEHGKEKVMVKGFENGKEESCPGSSARVTCRRSDHGPLTRAP